MLKVIELFAGIGSQHQALKNLHIEHEVVAISEIDKYAVQSYTALHGQPNNLGDITKIQELPKADLWTYSFPCQDISVAGNQKGLAKDGGTRSGLLWEVERLLLKAKENGTLPKYLLLENVKNLVGVKCKPDFDLWIDFLNGLGYWSYWQVLNAKDYGIPQNRERVFVVSILGKGYYKFPKKIPLELRLKDMLEDKVDEKYYLSEKLIKGFLKKEERNPAFKFEPRTENDTAACLMARYYKMGISDNYIAEPQCINEYDENGKQRKQHERIYDTNGTMVALCSGQSGRFNIVQPQCKVIGNLDIPNRHESALRVYDTDGIALACNTCGGGGLETKILQVDGLYLNDSADFHKDPLKDLSRCSKAQQHDAGVQTQNRIRKLTPRECWRLMGWKDTEIDKVIACGMSNSQMYKQAGNCIVVDVLEALFRELFLKVHTVTDINQSNYLEVNQIKMEGIK